MEATVLGVINYLIQEEGVKPEFAENLVKKHKDIVHQGIRLKSYNYYVACRILEEENVDDNWEGFEDN